MADELQMGSLGSAVQMLDVEQIVALVYEQSACSEVRPPGPVALLREMIGAKSITFVDGKGCIVGLPDHPKVRMRRGLHGEELCMAFAHAAAVVAFARHCPGQTLCEERIAPIASALVMPEPAVRTTVRAVGPRAEAVARIFVVPLPIARARLNRLGLAPKSGQYLRLASMKNAG